MPAYDDQFFSPPAPAARVTLCNPASGQSLSDILMLIDYGADATLLPQPAITQLGIQPDYERQYELEAFDGTSSVVHSVSADLICLRKTFKGQFMLVNQPAQTWGFLGRDVLNNLRLLLNGPQLYWEEFRLK